jgi:hypothetical protein
MASSLPPNLFDQTTLVSLGAILIILFAALGLSRKVLAPSTPSSLRFLFIWHAFDALVHFIVEGSFLYHCFFSSIPVAEASRLSTFYPDPHNYLGHTDRVHGSQAGGQNPFAQMWMVYARADKRWAGVDLVSSIRFPGAESADDLAEPMLTFDSFSHHRQLSASSY